MILDRVLGIATLAGAVLAPAVAAASCKAPITGKLAAPMTADGIAVNLIADGFTYPRGLVFDSDGHLLIADQGAGIKAIVLKMDDNGCVTRTAERTVIADKSLNHGLQLSPDGKTLYASSVESVWAWPYDAGTTSVASSEKRLLISNMTNSDHTTRTLLLSKFMPDMLIVARGSNRNVDKQAEVKSSGHSQLKAFNINTITKPYDFVSDGTLLGWGIRNDVGVAEEPLKGGIYTVENSVDDMTRLGIDIHEDNPGEELNYFGTMKNNKSPNQGANFGYPECYSAWKVDDIPARHGLEVGMQFAIGGGTDIFDRDRVCRQDRVAPRLVFQAHMAPLDIKFDTMGTMAWITFHGSWDRTTPAGYKLSMVGFKDGEPVEPSTSTKAATDMVWNQNTNICATTSKCFRPVGMAWDSMGRLWFSSDTSGEIYMVMKKGAKYGAIDPNASSSSSGGGNGAAPVTSASVFSVLVVGAVAALWLM